MAASAGPQRGGERPTALSGGAGALPGSQMKGEGSWAAGMELGEPGEQCRRPPTCTGGHALALVLHAAPQCFGCVFPCNTTAVCPLIHWQGLGKIDQLRDYKTDGNQSLLLVYTQERNTHTGA